MSQNLGSSMDKQSQLAGSFIKGQESLRKKRQDSLVSWAVGLEKSFFLICFFLGFWWVSCTGTGQLHHTCINSVTCSFHTGSSNGLAGPCSLVKSSTPKLHAETILLAPQGI